MDPSCGCFHSEQSAEQARLINTSKASKEFGDQLVELYLVEVAGKFLKPGIAVDFGIRMGVARADNDCRTAYTRVIGRWLMRRRQAFEIEQQVLEETKEDHWDVEAITAAGLRHWGGWTELRVGLDEAQLLQRIEGLINQAEAA